MEIVHDGSPVGLARLGWQKPASADTFNLDGMLRVGGAVHVGEVALLAQKGQR